MKCLQGRVRVPIGGKVRELPGVLGDRTSGILVPTVTVRMEEAYSRMNETANQWLVGLGLL